jgi:hypothetical protein
MFFLKKYVPLENEFKNAELVTENSDIKRNTEKNSSSRFNLIDGPIKGRKLKIFLVTVCQLMEH